jgi:hypothetical protein
MHCLEKQVLTNLLALRKSDAIFAMYLVNTTATDAIMWMIQ